MIHTQSLNKICAFGDGGQHRLKLFRPKKLQRMRIKSDGDGRDSQRAGTSKQLAKEGAMPLMHAVKVAKGKRPSSAARRRHFFPVESHDRHESSKLSRMNRTWLVAYNYNDPRAGRTVVAGKG